jgi:hypothetical protein
MIKSRTADGHVLRIGETRNAYKVMVRNREGKRKINKVDVGWIY